jgi:hypothetical protein
MRLRAASIVRLKSAFRHSDEILLKTKTLRLIAACSYVKKATRTRVYANFSEPILLITHFR